MLFQNPQQPQKPFVRSGIFCGNPPCPQKCTRWLHKTFNSTNFGYYDKQRQHRKLRLSPMANVEPDSLLSLPSSYLARFEDFIFQSTQFNRKLQVNNTREFLLSTLPYPSRLLCLLRYCEHAISLDLARDLVKTHVHDFEINVNVIVDIRFVCW